MYVTHSSANGIEAEKEPAQSSADPNADLFGDWCWKPDRYPQDPGYVYVGDELETFQLLYHEYTRGPAPILWIDGSYNHPWSFPAYKGPVAPPTRIGPAI